MSLRKVKTQQLIKELGMPDHTKFCGYVVHLPESDEFLFHLDVKPDYYTNYGWSKLPDHARLFDTHHEAQAVIDEYGKPAVVGLLFDLGKSYSLQISVP
jgi:hypothetical protein